MSTKISHFDIINNIKLKINKTFKDPSIFKFKYIDNKYEYIIIDWLDGPSKKEVNKLISEFNIKKMYFLLNREFTEDFTLNVKNMLVQLLGIEPTSNLLYETLQLVSSDDNIKINLNDLFRTEVTKEEVTITETKVSESVNDMLEIVQYTEKSFVIKGNTKPIKELLVRLGGKWNGNLSKDGEKFGAWIFPNTKLESVKEELKI
jgi:hypothetical protein